MCKTLWELDLNLICELTRDVYLNTSLYQHMVLCKHNCSFDHIQPLKVGRTFHHNKIQKNNLKEIKN